MTGPPTIVCGVSSATTPAELDELLALGVGEVYAGYVPPAWLTRYGAEVSPNRRYVLERQVTDAAALARIGAAARERGVRFVVAVNDHAYAPEARALLREVVAVGRDAGADGFIVADLSLLDELVRTVGAAGERIVSCEGGVYNAAAARLWVDHGATRLIFAREMRLDEMRAITAALADTDVSFEAFVGREYCANSSAVCFATHGYGQRSHFCSAHTRRTLVASGGGAERDLSLAPPGWSDEPDFLRAVSALHRCGLCAVGDLLAMGVAHLKLPGRSDSALDALRLLRRLLDGGDLSVAACQAVVGSEAFCASGENCYYRPGPPAARRHAFPGRGGGGGSEDPRSDRCGSEDPRSDRCGSEDPRSDRCGSEDPRSGSELALYRSVAAVTPAWLGQVAAGGLAAALDDDAPAWERAAHDTTLAVLAERPVAAPSRVYLGAELCALRLPSAAAVTAAVREARDAGFAATLVAPVAFQAVWETLVTTLDAVFAAPAAPDELVVNDLGLLAVAANRWPVRLVAGRLLNRMKRDPFAADADVLPAAEAAPADEAERRALRDRQSAAYGYPHLADPFWRDLLTRHRVAAIEWDALPTPLTAPLPTGFGHTIHAPWTYVTSARACPTAVAVEGAVSSWPTEACRRSCDGHAIVATYPWQHRPVVQRGAATFLDVAADLAVFWRSARPGFDRVVVHAGVPV